MGCELLNNRDSLNIYVYLCRYRIYTNEIGLQLEEYTKISIRIHL